jgi:steroid delta-isomerase-like uncharacterized protein
MIVVAMQFPDMYNTHTVDLLDDLLGRTYTGHIDAQTITGRVAAKTVIAGFLQAFPDVYFTVEDTVASGDRVTTRWTATATHQDAFAGIDATQRPVTMLGMTLFQNEGAQIGALWNVCDVAGLLQQLRP